MYHYGEERSLESGSCLSFVGPLNYEQILFMKKLFLGAMVVGVFVIYLVYQKNGPTTTIVTPPSVINAPAVTPYIPTPVTIPSAPSVTPIPTPEPPIVPLPTPVPAPTPKPVPVSMYRNGQYTGDLVDAYYGNVQVKAIISGGRLTDVQFLDYPKDRQQSQQISRYAMPLLTSEAIQAQSAQVDVVSGATSTSGGFQQSLATALAQAKN